MNLFTTGQVVNRVIFTLDFSWALQMSLPPSLKRNLEFLSLTS